MSRSRFAVQLAERAKRVKRVIAYPAPFSRLLRSGTTKLFYRDRIAKGGIADHALHALLAPQPLEIKRFHLLNSESRNEH